uniref:Uncharacterized protein n=1 Tax=Arundo donax TaxID=35708 RepID=A0A0A9CUN7_ARUDO
MQSCSRNIVLASEDALNFFLKGKRTVKWINGLWIEQLRKLSQSLVICQRIRA